MNLPKLGRPYGIHGSSVRYSLVPLFKEISKRLRKVNICCGEWDRVVCNSNLVKQNKPAAIFLDPPYQIGEYSDNVYEHSTDVFNDVLEWCRENGNNPEYRIALCGYENEKNRLRGLGLGNLRVENRRRLREN